MSTARQDLLSSELGPPSVLCARASGFGGFGPVRETRGNAGNGARDMACPATLLNDLARDTALHDTALHGTPPNSTPLDCDWTVDSCFLAGQLSATDPYLGECPPAATADSVPRRLAAPGHVLSGHLMAGAGAAGASGHVAGYATPGSAWAAYVPRSQSLLSSPSTLSSPSYPSPLGVCRTSRWSGWDNCDFLDTADASRSPLPGHYEPLYRRRPSLPLPLRYDDWLADPVPVQPRSLWKFTPSDRVEQCRHLWFDTPPRRHSEGELVHSRACGKLTNYFDPGRLPRVGEHVEMDDHVDDHADGRRNSHVDGHADSQVGPGKSHVDNPGSQVKPETLTPIFINSTSDSLVFVQFKCGRVDVFQPSTSVECHVNDFVIVDADRGKDLGRVVQDHVTVDQAAALKARQHHEQQAVLSEAAMGSGGATAGACCKTTALDAPPAQTTACQVDAEKPGIITPKLVLRLALPLELQQVVAKEDDERDAVELCQNKVREMGLNMRVVDAEFQWDRRKLTFFYHATKRIDFRDLVRDLFRHYKTRIWMCAVPRGAVNSRADVETLSPVPLRQKRA